MSRVVSVVSVLCVLASCASKPSQFEPKLSSDSSLSLNHNLEVMVEEGFPVFLGLPEEPGSQGQIGYVGYPGDSAEVFLAAVIVHGLLETGRQLSVESLKQEAANSILVPYENQIKSIYEAIGEKYLAQPGVVTSDTTKPTTVVSHRMAKFRLRLRPMIFMTHDERQLLLVSEAEITDGTNVRYRNIIEILSAPISQESQDMNPVNTWLEDDGKLFQSTVLSIFEQGVRLALMDAQGSFSAEAEHETFSFLQGGRVHFERAVLVGETKEHVIIRTLRKRIKAIPAT